MTRPKYDKFMENVRLMLHHQELYQRLGCRSDREEMNKQKAKVKRYLKTVPRQEKIFLPRR